MWERWNFEVCITHSLRETRELIQSHPTGFLSRHLRHQPADAPYGEVLDVLNAAATITIGGTLGDD